MEHAELHANLRELDRRSFLRLTGLAAAAGVLPTGCGGAAEELAPPAELSLQVLTPRSYAVFTAATQRIVGPTGAAAIRARKPDVGARADALLLQTPEMAPLLQQGLLLLEFGFFPVLGKLRPFTSLDADGQDAVLNELMQSRFGLKRALFKGVRSYAWMAFYGSEQTAAGIHYPGPFGNDSVGVADAMRYDLQP